MSGSVDPLEVRPVLVVLLGETLVPVVMARRVGSITVTDEVVDVPVLTPFVLLKPSFRELGLRSLTGWSFSRNSPLMSWRYSPARGSLPLVCTVAAGLSSAVTSNSARIQSSSCRPGTGPEGASMNPRRCSTGNPLGCPCGPEVVRRSVTARLPARAWRAEQVVGPRRRDRLRGGPGLPSCRSTPGWGLTPAHGHVARIAACRRTYASMPRVARDEEAGNRARFPSSVHARRGDAKEPRSNRAPGQWISRRTPVSGISLTDRWGIT